MFEETGEQVGRSQNRTFVFWGTHVFDGRKRATECLSRASNTGTVNSAVDEMSK